MKKNPRSGQLFSQFLKEEGIYEEVTAAAIKSVLAMQLAREMKRRHLSKSKLAAKMKTSRTQIDRLLDPDMTAVSLEVLQRAASAVGKELRVNLV